MVANVVELDIASMNVQISADGKSAFVVIYSRDGRQVIAKAGAGEFLLSSAAAFMRAAAGDIARTARGDYLKQRDRSASQSVAPLRFEIAHAKGGRVLVIHTVDEKVLQMILDENLLRNLRAELSNEPEVDISKRAPVASSNPTARQRPAVMYKFRTFPSLEGLSGWQEAAALETRNRVLSILRDGKLYASRGDQFNDAFELRPVNDLTSPGHLQEFLLKLADIGVKEGRLTKEDADNLVKDPRKLAWISSHTEEFAETGLAAVRESALIYCVAGNQKRTLLWSHYADGHRGIAIHLDSTRPPLSHAVDVFYSNSYPTIYQSEVLNDDTLWHLIAPVLFVKDLDWSYEDEWRLAVPDKPESEAFKAFEMRIEGQMFVVNPNVITGITIGAKMQVDARRALGEFAAANRPDLKFYVARLADRRFDTEVGDALSPEEFLAQT